MLSWNDQTRGNEAKRPERNQTERTAGTDSSSIGVSNHEFMAALFGESFGSAAPLVCCKPGNPVSGGYTPRVWPCPTAESGLNWYFSPGLYEPDSNGQPRAKLNMLARSMLSAWMMSAQKLTCRYLMHLPPLG